MARQTMEKVYADFRKGWLQDQHPMQQPEGTVKDIDNFDIAKDGTLSKRKGLSVKTIGYYGDVITTSTEIHRWDSVNGDPDTNFIVTVTEDGFGLFSRIVIRFYEASPPTSEVAVGSYLGAVLVNAEYDLPFSRDRLSVTTAAGRFFFSHSKYGIGHIRYSESSGNFILSKLSLEMRDTNLWEGFDDETTGIVNSNSSSLSPVAEYNLRNSGWGSEPTKVLARPYSYSVHDAEFPPIPYYKYEFATEYNKNQWPKLSELFHMAKSGGGSSPNEILAFNPSVFRDDFTGNTVPPVGKYKVKVKQFERVGYRLTANSHGDMRDKRNSDFPLAARATYTLTESPSKIAFYAGRLWYAGNGTYNWASDIGPFTKGLDVRSTLYFSQMLEDNIDNAEKCYQQNDPTAETVNQLLATDGGTLSLKEIGEIKELMPLGVFLYIIADNGVWRISGKDRNSFTAESYSIEKVSNVGVESSKGIATSEDTLFLATEIGILAVTSEGGFGPATITNLTENRINSFYKKFSKKVLKNVKMSYDYREKRLAVLAALPGQEEVDDNFYSRKANTLLFFDMELGTFYRYSFNTPRNYSNLAVLDIFSTEGSVTTTTRDYVVDSSDIRYTDSTGEYYWLPGESSSVETLKRLGLLSMSQDGTASILVFEDDVTYEDDFYNDTATYSATLNIGFDSVGSLISDKKQAPYIISYLERPYKLDVFGNKVYGGFVAEVDPV